MHTDMIEVLGGQHTAMARQKVSAEYPGNTILKHILAEVYVGLSDDEALRLASCHNINGHFVHKMTHRDYVSKSDTTYLQEHLKGRSI